MSKTLSELWPGERKPSAADAETAYRGVTTATVNAFREAIAAENEAAGRDASREEKALRKILVTPVLDQKVVRVFTSLLNIY